MRRGDQRHSPSGSRDGSRGRLTALVAAVLVLALVVGAGVAWQRGLLDEWLSGGPATEAGPAAIPPPAGVEEQDVAAPPAVAQPAEPAAAGGDVALAAVRRTLGPYLRDDDLGPHVLAAVGRLDGTGPTAYDRTTGRGDLAIPASTTKVVTSTAALLALGPEHTFETTVVQRGRQVVLVGGGDPFLERAPREADGSAHPYPARADVQTLAAKAARTLARRGVDRVRVGYDDSLFAGDAVNPRWEDDYVPDSIVSPTSALWVDEGHVADGFGREADPGAAAAIEFAAALTREGITVTRGPERTQAGAGQQIASVSSAPLGEIVERVLDVSDNDAAEVLLRHVGRADGGSGSIRDGRDGVRRLLRAEGVDLGDSVLYDGSGLSRDDRLDPQALVGVVRLAASDDHPDLRHVVTGLPVAGFTGSLTDRMDAGPAAGLGRVRAKTGTLSNVRALAGIALDLDGTPLVFVLMADRIADEDTLDASQALDSAAGSLGACRCG